MESDMIENLWETAWEKDECNIVWTLNDFSLLTEGIDLEIDSPVFCSMSNPLTHWFLRIYPFGFNKEEDVSVYLHLKDSSLKTTKANFTLNLVSKNKPESALQREFTHTFAKGECCGLSHYIERNKLLKNEDLLQNDNLTISCTVNYMIKRISKKIPNTAKEASKIVKQPNLLSTFESKLFSDVTLVVEDKEIAAHKCILATHSDVFLTMFSSDMEETKTNKVEIKDLAFEAVYSMVKSFYTGQAPPFGENYEAILKAADKYNAKGITSEIENQLINQVSAANACDSLILAYTYSLTKAKDFLKKYIFVEHFQDIRGLKQTQSLFAIPELCLELLKFIMQNENITLHDKNSILNLPSIPTSASSTFTAPNFTFSSSSRQPTF